MGRCHGRTMHLILDVRRAKVSDGPRHHTGKLRVLTSDGSVEGGMRDGQGPWDDVCTNGHNRRKCDTVQCRNSPGSTAAATALYSPLQRKETFL